MNFCIFCFFAFFQILHFYVFFKFVTFFYVFSLKYKRITTELYGFMVYFSEKKEFLKITCSYIFNPYWDVSTNCHNSLWKFKMKISKHFIRGGCRGGQPFCRFYNFFSIFLHSTTKIGPFFYIYNRQRFSTSTTTFSENLQQQNIV